ncbi:hypothetical protein M3172_16095 [Mesobacillus subterraneus]|uniref:hypothetical protein n=1 Tax=Mesobacillus subterraneus TaxID=285983 RepID=UPI00203E4060|nr:hypothetical protein [Mesobacillus subterraneus]MCM3574719.1 hypothetical protein [Mesobacillus subterraneus]
MHLQHIAIDKDNAWDEWNICIKGIEGMYGNSNTQTTYSELASRPGWTESINLKKDGNTVLSLYACFSPLTVFISVLGTESIDPFEVSIHTIKRIIVIEKRNGGTEIEPNLFANFNNSRKQVPIWV